MRHSPGSTVGVGVACGDGAGGLNFAGALVSTGLDGGGAAVPSGVGGGAVGRLVWPAIWLLPAGAGVGSGAAVLFGLRSANAAATDRRTATAATAAPPPQQPRPSQFDARHVPAP